MLQLLSTHFSPESSIPFVQIYPLVPVCLQYVFFFFCSSPSDTITLLCLYFCLDIPHPCTQWGDSLQIPLVFQSFYYPLVSSVMTQPLTFPVIIYKLIVLLFALALLVSLFLCLLLLPTSSSSALLIPFFNLPKSILFLSYDRTTLRNFDPLFPRERGLILYS